MKASGAGEPLTLEEAAKAFNPFGDRDGHWKAAVRLQDEHEAAVEVVFDDLITAQIDTAASLIANSAAWEPAIREDGDMGLARGYAFAAESVWMEFAERTFDAVETEAAKSYGRYSTQHVHWIEAMKAPDGVRATWLDRFRSFLDGPAATRVRRINESTRDFIREQLTLAADDKLAPAAVARRLRQAWQLVREGGENGVGRPLMIARTEIVGWANRASLVGADSVARELGLQMQKEWIATRDGRVRATHAAADGQVVEKDAPFSVGGSPLMHPGDQSAPASEVVNCRCSVGFIVE